MEVYRTLHEAIHSAIGGSSDVGSLWLVPLLALLGLVVYGFHPLARWRYRKFKGPPYRFLVGHLPEISKYGVETVYKNWAKQYGPVFVVFWGARPHVVVADAQLARRVSTRSAHKYDFPVLRYTKQEVSELQEIMFLISGEPWKEMRNAWTPYMSARKLENYFPLMLRCAKTLVSVVDPMAAIGEPVNIWPIMGRLTMDTIGSAAFGIQFNTLSSSSTQSADEALVSKLSSALTADLTSLGVEDPMVAMLLICPELKSIIRLLAHISPSTVSKAGFEGRIITRSVVHGLVDKARAQTQQQHHQQQEEASENNSSESLKNVGVDNSDLNQLEIDSESFLATMAGIRDKSGALKSASWVRAQALLFLIAGYETTALAITYSIYLLAANPNKEAKLLEEIDAFGREREPTFESLQELRYVNAVLQETLRLLPPGSFTFRESKEDMLLGEYRVPKGAWLNPSIYGIHHDEAYWKNPESFEPERFLHDSEASKSLGYMPFGEGARVCPGARFASQEARIALLKLYQRFYFRLTPGQVPLATKTVFTLVPANGEVNVTVHRRADVAY